MNLHLVTEPGPQNEMMAGKDVLCGRLGPILVRYLDIYWELK